MASSNEVSTTTEASELYPDLGEGGASDSNGAQTDGVAVGNGTTTTAAVTAAKTTKKTASDVKGDF